MKTRINCGGGARLPTVSARAARAGLTGIEFHFYELKFFAVDLIVYFMVVTHGFTFLLMKIIIGLHLFQLKFMSGKG